MKVSITEGIDFNLAEVISKSFVSKMPDAEATLRAYINRSSLTYVGKVDDQVACVCGVILPSLFSARAYLWMLTTDVADSHTFMLVRHSQMFIQKLLERFEVIAGHTEASQERSIKWLKWLGAKFGHPQGRMIPFEIIRHG